METLGMVLSGIGLVIALGLMITRQYRVNSRRREELDLTAHSLGLTVSTRDWFGPRLMQGSQEGFPVNVAWKDDSEERHTTFTVGGVTPGIELSSESVGTFLGKLVRGRDLETGDAVFDKAVYLRGDETTLRSLLGAEARRRVLEALPARVEHGEVRLRQNRLVQDPKELSGIVRSMVAVARALAPRARGAALAQNALQDPLPEVRSNCFETLLEQPGLDDLKEETCRKALKTSDPGLRLQASIHLGDVEGLRSSIRAALLSGDGLTRRLAVRAAAERRLTELLPDLRRAIGAAGSEEREEIAEALGRLGGPAETGTLLRLLRIDDLPVRLAAVRALADVGDASAVAALQELDGGVLGGELTREVRKAIAAIQSRLEGAGAGQLSLPDSEKQEGALSLTAQAGSLSIPAKK